MSTSLTFQLDMPPELLERIAERAAEILAARLRDGANRTAARRAVAQAATQARNWIERPVRKATAASSVSSPYPWREVTTSWTRRSRKSSTRSSNPSRGSPQTLHQELREKYARVHKEAHEGKREIPESLTDRCRRMNAEGGGSLRAIRGVTENCPGSLRGPIASSRGPSRSPSQPSSTPRRSVSSPLEAERLSAYT